MSDFAFRVDLDADEFCRSIIREMIDTFHISEDEAIARINDRFAGLVIVGRSVLYHEDEEFWASDIMYGHESQWWNDDNPTPLPAPSPRARWLQQRWWWRRWWRLRRQRWWIRLSLRTQRRRLNGTGHWADRRDR